MILLIGIKYGNLHWSIWMKIKLDVKNSVFAAPFFKYDFGFSYCTSNQDVTITDDLENIPESPFVFFDDRECASLKSRDIFKLDNFLGVLKFSKYDSLETYNSPVSGIHSSVHESIISESNKDFLGASETLSPLKQEDLDKIHISWSYPLFHERLEKMQPYCWRMGYKANRQFLERDIDCFFGGSIGFASLPLTHHRVQAVRLIDELKCNKLCYHYWTPCDLHKDKFPNLKPSVADVPKFGRPSLENYLNILKRSKIAISPWGNGESCFRDFEAALMGCVVIKPDSSHVYSCTDLKYVSCRCDFSDLEEKVDHILDNYELYQELIYENVASINQSRHEMFDRFHLVVENIVH